MGAVNSVGDASSSPPPVVLPNDAQASQEALLNLLLSNRGPTFPVVTAGEQGNAKSSSDASSLNISRVSCEPVYLKESRDKYASATVNPNGPPSPKAASGIQLGLVEKSGAFGPGFSVANSSSPCKSLNDCLLSKPNLLSSAPRQNMNPQSNKFHFRWVLYPLLVLMGKLRRRRGL